ncbi:unnamed protein product [Heligmosomoides polygyrus]|uniref:Uncharacterized protein n=1 Tax=Heligmosomoides polygyrus TaxID=6339 RepID=A0A183FM50_HELPZ|nr:unnamed protein product [Heligmosomoides polygyrus]
MPRSHDSRTWRTLFTYKKNQNGFDLRLCNQVMRMNDYGVTMELKFLCWLTDVTPRIPLIQLEKSLTAADPAAGQVVAPRLRQSRRF